MRIIKTAFLVALFNYIIVGAIVLAFKKNEVFVATPTIITDIVPTSTVTKIRPTAPTTTTSGGLATQTPAMVQPTTAPAVDNRCIIVVDGIRFDISKFRSQHSGGDIFQCGTDMSAVFHDRHPNSFLDRMSQYRI